MTAIAPITSHTKTWRYWRVQSAPTSASVVSREWPHLTRVWQTHDSIPGQVRDVSVWLFRSGPFPVTGHFGLAVPIWGHFDHDHRRTRRGVGGRPPSLLWNISGQTLFSGQAQVDQKSWMIKNISIQWKISGQLYFSGQAQVDQKSWMIKNISTQWKFSGQLCFPGKWQVAQKSWLIKNISIQWKISGQLYFSGQEQVAQKSSMIKKYLFNTVNSGHFLLVTASASCSRILNGKKYIQYSGKFHGKLCFSGQVKKCSIQYIQPVREIILKFLVRANTIHKEFHPLELKSKETTEFACNGTSRVLDKQRYCRIEVIRELKCM